MGIFKRCPKCGYTKCERGWLDGKVHCPRCKYKWQTRRG